MSPEELKQELLLIPANWRARRARKNAEWVSVLNDIFPNINLNTQILCLMNNKSPYCVICQLPSSSYAADTCSNKCNIELHKRTCLAKYGVENIQQLSATQEKRINTLLDKHGAKVSDKTRVLAKNRAQQLNEKGKKTLKEKYNVTNPGQLPEHRQKCINSLQDHYGVSHYLLSAEAKEQSKSRRLSKWEIFSPSSIQISSILPDTQKLAKFDNPNQVITFYCAECENKESLPSETFKRRIQTSGTPCQKCGNTHIGRSAKEKKLCDFIESLGFHVETNTKLLDGMEIDIFIPEKNIGFEFNGLFWHNDLKKAKTYHISKLNIAEGKGIKLIQIFEDEWDFQRNIVESRIKNILGIINSPKIYARKCSVRIIPSHQAKQFCIENHIQGYAPAAIKLGLFFNDILVSVMTFSTLSPAKGQTRQKDHWELSRFCSLVNCSVVGGASKLFSFFIKNHSPGLILSFADKRWSTGNIYNILGFNKQKDTNIGYWYISDGKRIHRYALRKTKVDNQELTEYENRLAQGYLRIWDCGHSKWIWESKKKGN